MVALEKGPPPGQKKINKKNYGGFETRGVPNRKKKAKKIKIKFFLNFFLSKKQIKFHQSTGWAGTFPQYVFFTSPAPGRKKGYLEKKTLEADPKILAP